MRYLSLGLSTILMMFMTGCSEAPKPVADMPIVSVYEVPVSMTEKLRNFPAIVQAQDLTHLSFNLNGEIIQLPADEGTRVKKGELLAKLDPTNYELSVKEKKAKVKLSKTSMMRAKAMVEKGNMAKSTFDELEAQYEMALADYNYAKVQLDYVELRAPFDGIIATVQAEKYQATVSGKTVVTLHKLEKAEVQIAISDALVASVDKALVRPKEIALAVTLDAYPNKTFIATYKEHTREYTQENRSFVLTLEMDIDPDYPALQGMPGSVVMDLAKVQKKGLSYAHVPLAAVLLPDNLPGDSFERIIWKIDTNNVVTPVKVQVGNFVKLTNVEVIGDIQPGDKVVTKGFLYLKDGIEVKIAPDRNKEV